MTTTKIPTKREKYTHPVSDTEDMAIVFAGLLVLSDVSKEVHVVTVLTGAEDVGDFMITDYFLQMSTHTQQ